MHVRFVTFLAVGLLMISVMAGCDRKPASSKGPRVAAAGIQGPGVVKGKVLFIGTPPPVAQLRNEPCCEGAPATLSDESVIVNPNGTLANTVIYIHGGQRADGKDLPPAKLDQKFCQYVPHVVGVVVGQKLTVSSSDPTIHNVHYQSQFAGDQNRWTRPGEQSFDTSFKQAEFIQTKCDVHPWMSAYICVLDTPLYAITSTTGEFSIRNIPAGEYKLVAWHERYGKIETPLTVKDATPIEQDISYAPPAR